MKLFVGNLPWTTTEEALSQVFAAYGIVDQVRVITDRDTGRSRGFGFVDMPDTREAEAAIEGLNGTALGGRTLSVSEARDRDERPRRSRW
jgi:RNA recognition motif-containing protein